MRKNPERLAWIILAISFFICIGLAVLAPLGGRWYVLNASVTQRVTLEVQRGPLRVTMAGRGAAVAIAEVRDEIPERTVVATDSTVGRLVIHAPQEDGPVIATVQLYDNTEVALSSARSPRFSASHLPHEVALEIRAGRVRINVSGDDGRDMIVKIQTPHGTGLLTEGSYEIQGNATTKVTVRRGRATIAKLDEPIGPGEYATFDSEWASGPSPADPNLISNGNFQSPLENGWVSYANQEEEPPGSVEIVKDEGQQVASFYRSGSDHAEVGIRQEINYDVRDFASLRLHMAVYIVEHNVPVCGVEGSECPVMVRIIYEEANGAEQEWLQGFYSLLNTDPDNQNPSVCRTCSTRNPHIQVRENTWYPYLSLNLIPRLSSQDGEPPTTIKSITIYASGHAYGSMVAEVELIGHE
jgi:hypothetical protein